MIKITKFDDAQNQVPKLINTLSKYWNRKIVNPYNLELENELIEKRKSELEKFKKFFENERAKIKKIVQKPDQHKNSCKLKIQIVYIHIFNPSALFFGTVCDHFIEHYIKFKIFFIICH